MPDIKVQEAYQQAETTNTELMMRIYSSLLMSSLLLSGIAVNAQSFETRSAGSSPDRSITAFLTAQAENQTFYADSDRDTAPERGSGR